MISTLPMLLQLHGTGPKKYSFTVTHYYETNVTCYVYTYFTKVTKLLFCYIHQKMAAFS